MSCPFSLENVKFRETAHMAFEAEYVTASGKPKTYYRTRYSDWVTEKTFVKQYQKIREKF